MTNVLQKLIVFTDLDGTFLDHETYSYQASLETLNRLKELKVPVIFTTSKTWAEVRDLQDEVSISEPCIVENGAAIYLGESDFSQSLYSAPYKVLGKDYNGICTFIDQIDQNLSSHILGFSQMSVSQIIEHTGLPKQKAIKAKDRKASEPFLWSGNDAELKILKIKAKEAGLKVLQGGRFYHLLSNVDKSSAIKWLLEKIEAKYPAIDFHTCALGDGPNDEDMLKTVDTGIVIANPNVTRPNITGATGQIVYSKRIGPQGWSDELNKLLYELGPK
ncbi:putative Glucosyl-3-phosphoglycerate/mannosyl-3-phosphoglycerate phosphatase [Candidatus Terasakiella magnetica]|uniref:Putative Glucosyl-3-phosphoglycerate/mannosyl-3-phosphoglycerate phosphatase n=1 Tax=Candidatus Terasakiella magnetica TaxID=1867952 RepID=A0A1C3RL90_9PROT|nr:HAD-IIB family hydrolase [Candidatus Terasakiella magnetica]SCA57949.1 putative Glucosyl-3-phosphoglycerate/mannosyl-3-phosphoglycerate phosphatase [Candidatus Terasakiella magnetica]